MKKKEGCNFWSNSLINLSVTENWWIRNWVAVPVLYKFIWMAQTLKITLRPFIEFLKMRTGLSDHDFLSVFYLFNGPVLMDSLYYWLLCSGPWISIKDQEVVHLSLSLYSPRPANAATKWWSLISLGLSKWKWLKGGYRRKPFLFSFLCNLHHQQSIDWAKGLNFVHWWWETKNKKEIGLSLLRRLRWAANNKETKTSAQRIIAYRLVAKALPVNRIHFSLSSHVVYGP